MISDPRRIHLEFGIHLLEVRITISPVLNIVPEILMARCNFQQGVKDAQALAYHLAEVLEFLYIGKRNVIVNTPFTANTGKQGLSLLLEHKVKSLVKTAWVAPVTKRAMEMYIPRL